MVVPLCCVCFVRVSWRRALLDRGLGPPAPFHPALLGEFFVSPSEAE